MDPTGGVPLPPPQGQARPLPDGSLDGPRLPPPPPPPPAPPVLGPAPVSEAVLAIPLGTRELVRQALDLLTRTDAGLRGASFYIGFMLLVTVAPVLVIVGLAFTISSDAAIGSPGSDMAWAGWMALAGIPAFLGYVAAGTEARALATAVIGGRVEGRPLRLRQSIAVSRRRFWRIFGAQLLIGVLAAIATGIGQFAVGLVLGPKEEIALGVSLLISLLISAPFVYVPAGIVLGEVGIMEAIARSFRLANLRRSLALVVTLFGVLSQFIVVFGLSEGLDAIARVVIGSGLGDAFPRALVVPLVATMVFALGTLLFLVEAIAAAPAVHAFAALTHYTRGLEVGRREPVAGRRLWNPWVTPGLAGGAILGLLAMLGGILSLPV